MAWSDSDERALPVTGLFKTKKVVHTIEPNADTKRVVHIIDPNADTVIILKNPVVRFAEWGPIEASATEKTEKPAEIAAVDDATDWEARLWSSTVSRKQIKKKGKKGRITRDNGPLDESFNEATASTTSLFGNRVTSTVPTENATTISPALECAIDSGVDITSANASSAATTQPEPTVKPADEEGIHYHVSSRHLILASKIFRTMMTGENWAQGFREDDGLFYTRPEQWDAEAFLVLMNVLHLQNRKVPRTLSLEMLAKIAVIVDFYECEEAVEVFSKMWIDDL
ncbi:hypothetical protein K491DRAFT_715057 [Lophiostoma macrostomum CBS 122681]|uniref:BTB domain-containing protein n=1 Tax=Lophiostoma macrostomum CBS 122681 TaxID=1314788 RepID=A0A6A6TA53_9PLEO|nr:hypothetical protein K491DRAFT_715057 [Lophiostoma macrostomum CBS 122681]